MFCVRKVSFKSLCNLRKIPGESKVSMSLECERVSSDKYSSLKFIHLLELSIMRVRHRIFHLRIHTVSLTRKQERIEIRQ